MDGLDQREGILSERERMDNEISADPSFFRRRQRFLVQAAGKPEAAWGFQTREIPAVYGNGDGVALGLRSDVGIGVQGFVNDGHQAVEGAEWGQGAPLAIAEEVGNFQMVG